MSKNFLYISCADSNMKNYPIFNIEQDQYLKYEKVNDNLTVVNS